MKVRLLWPVSHIFTVVYSKLCFFFINFNFWKLLKMLKIGCFKLFKAKSLFLRYASRYSHPIFCSTLVKVRLLWPVSHIFTVVYSKLCFFKNFNCWKMLKMLKIGCFKLFKAKSLFLRYASRYSHAIFCSTVVSHIIVTSFTHIHSGLQQNLFF